MKSILKKSLLSVLFWGSCVIILNAQPLPASLNYQSLSALPPQNENMNFGDIQWNKTGHLFTNLEEVTGGFEIVEYDPANNFSRKVLVASSSLIVNNATLPVEAYTWYPATGKIVLFSNSKRVWRENTRGDFWLYDVNSKSLKKLGNSLPESSLQFAKLSADGSKAAYVSKHNIYVEDLKSGAIKQLTTDGTNRIINGTFDWAYEEELFCRDGFRWSPDGQSIAFWQIDASKIGNYLMLNTTDSIYSFNVPVEYPKVGYDPSKAKIGVVNVQSAQLKWMDIPGDPVKNYLPRMDWAGNSNEVMVQQLNRKQDSCKLYLVNTQSGLAKKVYEESDAAWIDMNYFWQYDRVGWDFINNGKEFLWTSEKDGWRHVYRLNKDGSNERLLSKGKYDVMDIVGIDQKKEVLYFYGSTQNATQQYLYCITLDGKGSEVLVSPAAQKGTHKYNISPDAQYAVHGFSNYQTAPTEEFISLASKKRLKEGQSYNLTAEQLKQYLPNPKSFFQVTTIDGVTIDGWVIKPANFDETKKYPVLFDLYGEPAAATVKDSFSPNSWHQSWASQGYVIISLDNRGTPVAKGREWRKAIFKNIGNLNIRDQAMAAKEILKWKWVDSSRIAVWGWSGGGSSTQNLMFKYPDIFKTGMAVAGVANLLTYDNIYEERYMGLLPQAVDAYKQGSSINFVSGLKGNLLLVHGSGDDNVHYQNHEMLVNALIEAGKPFSMMVYPNRSHSINEGKGTDKHLFNLLTTYLVEHCPPGAR
ncbi:S9 family peptidase [Solitalea sp. MAHUQ-68]|uniref:S9 family peptidase n=1 Tax=Solitalea agri TaxID=2953739 RepID=A0A9X2JDW3_9SPHI|nr:DPP IV N-terminal domain-containing protein [Solitalea agri]MCO4294548.1 S9 family peptidase [Solitalea agri]